MFKKRFVTSIAVGPSEGTPQGLRIGLVSYRTSQGVGIVAISLNGKITPLRVEGGLLSPRTLYSNGALGPRKLRPKRTCVSTL